MIMEQITDDHINQFEQMLLSLDWSGAEALFSKFKGQMQPLQELERLILPALERIGEGWEEGRVSLSQVYMSGKMCEELVDAFLPPSDPARIINPPMAIAVLDDYHLLGMRLVYSALRASGYELLRYGHQDVDNLVNRVQADKIQILLVSVLMLRSALQVQELRAQLDEVGCQVKLVVGGAPFRLDANLWREVGADATADTAAASVAVIQQLVTEMTS